jgi:tetratricopeptide (TPR) repeat protein
LARAITVLREAVAVKPDVVILHLNLGHVLNMKGDLDEAIRAFRRVLALEPDSISTHKHLGLTLDRRGDRAGLDEVIEKVRQLIQRKPNEPEACSVLGDLLLKKKDLDGARAAFRRAKDLLPRDNFDAHFNLGRHLKDERLFDEALAVIQYCEELATKTKRADLQERAAREARETKQAQLLTTGREHASRREWGQAAGCYAQLLNRDRSPNDEVCFEHAALLLLSGDQEGYRTACARMVERCARDRGFRTFLAARAWTLAPGSPEETARAGQLAEQELKASPPRFWLALTYQRLGKTEQARSQLETATKWLAQYRDGVPARAEQELGLHLHNWLEAHILSREAEAGLGPGPPAGKP